MFSAIIKEHETFMRILHLSFEAWLMDQVRLNTALWSSLCQKHQQSILNNSLKNNISTIALGGRTNKANENWIAFVDGVEVAQETLETEDFCDIDNDHEKTKVTDFKGRGFKVISSTNHLTQIIPRLVLK